MEAPGDLRSKLMGQQVSLNLEQTNNIFQNPQSDWAVLKTVLFYSVLILVLPIGSFFATKSLLFEWFLGQVINFVEVCHAEWIDGCLPLERDVVLL